MSAIPDQPERELLESIEEDVAALLMGDFGVRAFYWPGGAAPAGGAAVVPVYVSPLGGMAGAGTIGSRSTSPPGAGAGNRTPVGSGALTTGRSGLFQVELPRAGHTATDPGDGKGVASDGGVLRLAKGDVFVVPGECVGRPDVEAAYLRIGDGVAPLPGKWIAEAAAGIPAASEGGGS